MLAKILKVDRVSLAMARSNPALLLISAIGTTPTLGWRNGQLLPCTYIAPPQDGIWDMDFVGESPEIGLTQLDENFPAYLSIVKPSWCTGVRIRASLNFIESSGGVASGELFVRGGVIDVFPWIAAEADRVFLVNQELDSEGDASDLDEKSNSLLDNKVEYLLGRRLRVYKEGDAITKDYRWDRTNFELDKSAGTVVRIWNG